MLYCTILYNPILYYTNTMLYYPIPHYTLVCSKVLQILKSILYNYISIYVYILYIYIYTMYMAVLL